PRYSAETYGTGAVAYPRPPQRVVQTLDAAPQYSYGSYNVNMNVAGYCTNDLCSFSWEESYHTPFCGPCPGPVLAILHRHSPRCGAARVVLLKADTGVPFSIPICSPCWVPGASHHLRCCLVASQGEKEKLWTYRFEKLCVPICTLSHDIGALRLTARPAILVDV